MPAEDEAYQQEDEELAQGTSTLAIAVGAMGTHTSAMTIRVCDNPLYSNTAVIVYQPQMAL